MGWLSAATKVIYQHKFKGLGKNLRNMACPWPSDVTISEPSSLPSQVLLVFHSAHEGAFCETTCLFSWLLLFPLINLCFTLESTEALKDVSTNMRVLSHDSGDGRRTSNWQNLRWIEWEIAAAPGSSKCLRYAAPAFSHLQSCFSGSGILV